MIQIIKFGDIFNHKECEYICLAVIDDRTYTARILDYDLTKDIERVSRIASAGGDRAARVKNLKSQLFCYVILSTEEFKNRAANYATGASSNLTFDLRGSLNDEDRKNLKEAIIKDEAYIAPELIEEIKKNMI
mgnify:FL=1